MLRLPSTLSLGIVQQPIGPPADLGKRRAGNAYWAADLRPPGVICGISCRRSRRLYSAALEGAVIV